MQAATTDNLAAFIARNPEQPIWVACEDCRRRLGRHSFWEERNEDGPYVCATSWPADSHRGVTIRTAVGLYGTYWNEETRYIERRCYCFSGHDGDRPKRRADKVGSLPIRTDADGKTWVDF